MTGYTIPLTCPHCGALMAHTAGSTPRLRSVVALCACTECGSQYRLDVVLSVLSGPAIRDTLPSEPPHQGVERDLSAPGAALIDTIMRAEAEMVPA